MKIYHFDKIFSEFIRKRDADCFEMVVCITCGKRLHWQSADCGHYIGRRNMATRFDPINCNAQCRECNSKDNKQLYREKLIEKYSLHEVEELEQRSKKHKKWTEWELKEHIKNTTQ